MIRADAVELCCNGEAAKLAVAADELLLDVLRRDLRLTGTKLGCGTGDCGACTVVVDGDAVCSCLIYAVECDGRRMETIEAIAETPIGRLVVEQLEAHGAVQCGICTPGIVVMATQFLDGFHREQPTDAQITAALAGNLCRCTGYITIKQAVVAAGKALVERLDESADGSGDNC